MQDRLRGAQSCCYQFSEWVRGGGGVCGWRLPSEVHQCGAGDIFLIMGTRQKVASNKSVRQSVTIPARLALEVRRVAKERHVTMSRALVALAERGVRAEAEAKEQLNSSYRRFIEESDPTRKNEAGRDLIRTIFGKDSIAEDSVL